jgi:predicted RNA-binding protein with PIN domain
METIIIDAYNLMHKVPELRFLLEQDQDICVDTMIQKLSSHYFGKGMKIILVFDGMGKNKTQQNIEVKFSKTQVGNKYENADEYIKHLIESSRHPKKTKIVSSDRGITWFAKDCGCKIQSADSFWGEVKEKRIQRIEQIRESKEKPDYVTKGEVEYFLREFSKRK